MNLSSFVGSIVKSRGLLVLLAFQPAWFSGATARAASYVVTASEDEPDAAPGDGECASRGDVCTLRAAVDEANATPGFDEIYLSALGEPYRLERGALVISDQVQIAGREARWTIIDAGGASRLFEIVSPSDEPIYVRLLALTLDNGFAGEADPRGGAVLNDFPRSLLRLDRSVVRNSYAASAGGGIYNAGSLELLASAVTDNRTAFDDPASAGGGIYNAGYVSLARSWIHGNAAARGAGLANESVVVDISNSTFSTNRARERGGALSNEPGPLGALPTAAVTFSTFVYNQAGDGSVAPLQPGMGGGIYNAGALQLANSIIARNDDLASPDSASFAPDCVSEAPAGAPADSVSVTSLGGLVWGVLNDRCAHAADLSDQSGSAASPLDPGLSDSSSSRPGEVAFGYEPLEGSVALDAALSPRVACLDQDQWAATRPAPGYEGATARCDSGAIELNAERRRRIVMMVVGQQQFVPTDLVLSVKLAEYGLDVVDETPTQLSPEVFETDLVLISETVTSSELPSWLFTVEKPILTLEPAAFDELGMTEEAWDRAQGSEYDATSLLVDSRDTPISVGFGESGAVEVTDRGAKFAWGAPPADSEAFTVAQLASAPGRWAVFGYEAGARLADGSLAAAPRVAFFAAENTPQRLNANGWILFNATLSYLVP